MLRFKILVKYIVVYTYCIFLKPENISNFVIVTLYCITVSYPGKLFSSISFYLHMIIIYSSLVLPTHFKLGLKIHPL